MIAMPAIGNLAATFFIDVERIPLDTCAAMMKFEVAGLAQCQQTRAQNYADFGRR